jgi:dGTPase
MEAAQISRDMARAIGLNEDLAECIALAHDLGHPPFGHTGEAALNDWMKQHGLSFEHNEQSLRIVTILEEHSSAHPGLNLNLEIIEGIQKHRTGTSQKRNLSLEAQLVNLADEIGYTGHDCEDGIEAELFTPGDLADVPLAKKALELALPRDTSVRGSLIRLLVMDLYAASDERLHVQKIKTLDEVYGASRPLIVFSSVMRKELDELSRFLHERMYEHPRVLKGSHEGKEIIPILCTHFFDHPTAKILHLREKTGSPLCEAVKDYVAGMTDDYARSVRKAI